jgi:hypothetical protein
MNGTRKMIASRRRAAFTGAARLTLIACSLGLGFRAGDDRLSGQEFERDPINYSSATPDNCLSRLQKRMDAGDVRLKHDEDFGYLSAVLQALSVPESSQSLVFSKTSFQRHRIAPRTPRALYFNDEVYVGFCQYGDVVEISAVDPQLGTVFYSLDQEAKDQPRFLRHNDTCLLCHGGSQTQGVPGHLVRSVYSDTGGFPILSGGTHLVNHTSPLTKRWGGWYVTGTHGDQAHLGNLIVTSKQVPNDLDNRAGLNVTNLAKFFDCSTYLTPHSDIVALLVLEHQTEAQNLLIRASFVTRQALHQEAALNRDLNESQDKRWNSTTVRIKDVGDALVKYLLFSGETTLTSRIQGTSSFAADFPKRGQRDRHGRALRDFDLERRIFKYPCSYLIYSPSFDAIPTETRDYVYHRLWDILTGTDTSPEFAHLSATDRQAIREILIDTKPGLPTEWRSDK